jgi:hypothetical protein
MVDDAEPLLPALSGTGQFLDGREKLEVFE